MKVTPAPRPTSVYRYYDSAGLLIYVGITGRGMARNVEHNKSKDWWPYVAHQEVDHYETRDAALAAEKSLIQKHLPPFNRQHNPHHEQALRSYLVFASVPKVPATYAERRATRTRFPLSVLPTPLPGHDVTLYSSPVDADVLHGDLISTGESAIVSTPQRKRAGRVTDIRYRGGVILVGITGKYLPENITHGKATLKAQNKPAGFTVTKVFLNDPHDLKPDLTGTWEQFTARVLDLPPGYVKARMAKLDQADRESA